jgi:hypothetical protein
MDMLQPISTDQSAAHDAQAALLARLAQLDRKQIRVRPPQSLQPTPEAARSKVRRLRRKRILLQRSQRSASS